MDTDIILKEIPGRIQAELISGKAFGWALKILKGPGIIHKDRAIEFEKSVCSFVIQIAESIYDLKFEQNDVYNKYAKNKEAHEFASRCAEERDANLEQLDAMERWRFR